MQNKQTNEKSQHLHIAETRNTKSTELFSKHFGRWLEDLQLLVRRTIPIFPLPSPFFLSLPLSLPFVLPFLLFVPVRMVVVGVGAKLGAPPLLFEEEFGVAVGETVGRVGASEGGRVGGGVRAMAKGDAEGMTKGDAEGMNDGMSDGMSDCMDNGRDDGMSDCIDNGRDDGMDDGVSLGMELGTSEMATIPAGAAAGVVALTGAMREGDGATAVGTVNGTDVENATGTGIAIGTGAATGPGAVIAAGAEAAMFEQPHCFWMSDATFAKSH